MYLSDVDEYDMMAVYYFSDTAAFEKGDANIFTGQVIKSKKAVCCHN